MTFRHALLLAVAITGQAGCSSCGQSSYQSSGPTEDASDPYILAEPDGKAFRLNRPRHVIFPEASTKPQTQP